jgi:regulator of replication initiation timing
MILIIIFLAAGGVAITVVVVRLFRRGRLEAVATPVVISGLPRQTPELIEVPASPCIAWLFVEDGPMMQGDTIPLSSMEITIGSSPSCDVILEGEGVPGLACRIGFTSDSHAVLTVERGARVAINSHEIILETQLAARESQLETVRAEANPLRERLVAMERQHGIDEASLFKLWAALEALKNEHEQVVRENNILRAECERLREGCEHRERKRDDQAAENHRLRSSLASVEMLLRLTEDNAISQSAYQTKELDALRQRISELQDERDHLLRRYGESSTPDRSPGTHRPDR